MPPSPWRVFRPGLTESRVGVGWKEKGEGPRVGPLRSAIDGLMFANGPFVEGFDEEI